MQDPTEAYHALKEELEITDDNVGEYRFALSFGKEYSQVVAEQANIVIESIKIGQSMIGMGELMRHLYNATHKMCSNGIIRELPGDEYFKVAAKVAGEAIEYIKDISRVTEEFAAATISCNDTVDMSYV